MIEMGILDSPFTNNKPGRKWFNSFLKRHPVVSQKHVEYINRVRAAIKEKISAWFTEMKEYLINYIEVFNYPERIWNIDETAVFLSPKGSLVLTEIGKS